MIISAREASIEYQLRYALEALHGRSEVTKGMMSFALRNYNRLAKKKSFEIWRSLTADIDKLDRSSLGLYWSLDKKEALSYGGNILVHARVPISDVNLIKTSIKYGWSETEFEIEILPEARPEIISIEPV